MIMRLIHGRRKDLCLCTLTRLVIILRKEGMTGTGIILVVKLEARTKSHGYTYVLKMSRGGKNKLDEKLARCRRTLLARAGDSKGVS